MRVVNYVEGNYQITTVDYVVVRVSLLGMSKERLTQLGKLLRISCVPEVRKYAKAILSRAERRRENEKLLATATIFGLLLSAKLNFLCIARAAWTSDALGAQDP